MKRYIASVFLGMALVVCLAVPSGSAHAATYQTTTDIAARLQALVTELRALQAQLALMQGTPVVPTPSTGNQQCFPSGYGTLLCYTFPTTQYPSTQTGNKIKSVEADLDDNSAEVLVEYKNGREDEYTLGGVDTKDDVIEFIADETNESESYIRSIIEWDGDLDDNDRDSDDVESIDVTIDEDDDEADVRVEYEDGDIERFTVDETDEDDIIDEVADELDMDEDDVEDIIDFDDDNDDDVESINVEIDEDDNDAEARVEYEDGDTDTFHYNTDDEDEIIEELADDLDMDEDDVEDLVDFDYIN